LGYGCPKYTVGSVSGYRAGVESKIPLAGLVDRPVISMQVFAQVIGNHLDGIAQAVLADGLYFPAVVQPTDGVMIEYGWNTHHRQEPDIIVFVQVELYDVIIGKSVFPGEIPECPAVEAADALVGGEPYKSVPVL